MLRLVGRYTHVPLAAVSVLLLLAIIAWLLVHWGDGVWAPALRLAAPTPAVVAIPPDPPAPSSTASTSPAPAASPANPAGPLETPVPRPRREPSPRGLASAERYVLESGPFTSPEVADRFEDQLSSLGYTTVRFRKQDVTRLYVVAATGFASTEEAKHAAGQLGRGAVIEAADAAEVLVDRLPSLGEAIAAARPLRARGFEVRVSEALSQAAIYFLRYGQFSTRAQAQALRNELARGGIKSRVVKVR